MRQYYKFVKDFEPKMTLSAAMLADEVRVEAFLSFIRQYKLSKTGHNKAKILGQVSVFDYSLTQSFFLSFLFFFFNTKVFLQAIKWLKARDRKPERMRGYEAAQQKCNELAARMKSEAERQDLLTQKEEPLLKMGKWLTLQEMQDLAANVWTKMLEIALKGAPSKEDLLEYQGFRFFLLINAFLLILFFFFKKNKQIILHLVFVLHCWVKEKGLLQICT